MAIDIRGQERDPRTTVGMPAVVEAEVYVGPTHTRYLRAGSGPAVVLLHSAGEGPEVWLPCIERLACRFRVIAPDVEPGGSTRGRDAVDQGGGDWLRGFLDGLGVESVRIIARGAAGEIAARFAWECPDRVREVLLTEPGGASLLLDALLPAPDPPGASGASAPCAALPLRPAP